MSNSGLARRTEIRVELQGVDISDDVNNYLLSLSYTDNEEDKTDDLQLTFDDRDGKWLNEWLNTPAQPAAPAPQKSGYNIGDEVIANGQPKYTSYGTKPGAVLTDYKGKITHLNLKDGVPFPIHVDQKGWFAESEITPVSAQQDNTTKGGGIKGAEIHVVILQKNWESDGMDRVLDCGVFEVDSVDASGPPAKVSIKGTSIPYTSTVRTQLKTKAWETIKLSAVAAEIASANGLTCMFESAFDPLYTRKEQVQESDIVFLQGLCKAAGISLKVTAKILVLFDAREYEAKDAIRLIQRGEADVLSYRFGTNFNDTAYSKCHVSYTDPKTQKTIEYTYTPRNTDGSGQVLEINEKVSNREEARQLAMKRLRQKNKGEYTAEFSLVGDARLVAGVTVQLSGYGFFDGKYIIESAAHTPTGGYKVNVKLRRVLEEY